MSRFATLVAALAAALATGGWAQPQEGAPGPTITGYYDVREFGAAGDAKTDDLEAFSQALQAAGEQGAGVVWVPPGEYLISGHLDIPRNVTVKGIWEAPPRSTKGGSVLLAVEGAGQEDGPPFITLHENSCLSGLAVLYPEQKDENPPVPYPWCVRGIGDNCSIVNVLLANPYQAVDFGTHPAGRHYINGLYSQALRRGIVVDKCFDVGRISNVHLWPFWKISGKCRQFTYEQGEAFIIGRTDWEYMSNCFCIGFQIGFRFVARNDGPGNAVLTQCGSDVGPVAVQVDQCQPHSGLAFVNGQLMATVRVAPTNAGPVKFTSCGFWPVKETGRQADLEGRGHVTFSACHFAGWDNESKGEPAIWANCEGLTVTGSHFLKPDANHIVLGEQVKAAVIGMNRFHGPARIDDRSDGDVQIGLNAEQ